MCLYLIQIFGIACLLDVAFSISQGEVAIIRMYHNSYSQDAEIEKGPIFRV